MILHLSFALALALCVQSSTVFGFSNNRRASNGSTDFVWADLKSSKTIDWTPCYDGFECARLSVPWDWTAPESSTKSFGIALLKLPANVSESSPEWKGPILVNPGGPGASGVGVVLQSGQSLQEIVGGDYSLIGFDPRGAGETIPAISCFPDQLHRSLWDAYTRDTIDYSNIAVQWARSKALSEVCVPLAIEQGGEYINTPSVARDMIAINEAAWEAAGSTTASQKGVMYWGFSYGTTIGQTFATMFPDRVHRVVLNGVVVQTEYYGGIWAHALLESRKVMDIFFEYCSQAGAAACPFHGNESAAQIELYLNKLLQRLEVAPVSYKTDAGDPDVITNSDIHQLIYTTLNTPLVYFPLLAEVLAAVEAGGYIDISSDVRANVTCDETPVPPTLLPPAQVDAQIAVFCSDSNAVSSNMSLATFTEYLDYLNEQNPYVGGQRAKTRGDCVGWDIKPKGLVYNGTSWGATTKTGMLFVSNIEDPITPRVGAEAAAKLFPGSALLVQTSVGHTTFPSPSVCTARYVREYFDTGVLPANGTLCEPDELPFGLSPKNGTAVKRSVVDFPVKRASLAAIPNVFGRHRLPY